MCRINNQLEDQIFEIAYRYAWLIACQNHYPLVFLYLLWGQKHAVHAIPVVSALKMRKVIL